MQISRINLNSCQFVKFVSNICDTMTKVPPSLAKNSGGQSDELVRASGKGNFSRPCGTRFRFDPNPAINRRAILRSSSGTLLPSARFLQPCRTSGAVGQSIIRQDTFEFVRLRVKVFFICVRRCSSVVEPFGCSIAALRSFAAIGFVVP